MRLNKISPWSGAPYAPPRKVEDAAAASTKPPDVDAGVSGVQIQSVGPDNEPPPDGSSTHAIDIRI